MGCVSSTLLDHDDDFSQLGGSRFGHHIVSLTSSTYGLLTIDPPNAPTPPRFALAPLRSDPPEVINSWELMADLDSSDSSRFAPNDKENSHPNLPIPAKPKTLKILMDENSADPTPKSSFSISQFERLCPPGGENKVVIYTTTLRGIRKTFEACNAARAALQAAGVAVCERDVSMHNMYREELRELMKRRENENEDGGGLNQNLIPIPIPIPPKVFVKGRYIGGAEEVLRINEEGCLGKLLEGVPKARAGVVCQGCGGVGFLPCFDCNGSCKVFEERQGRNVAVRCGRCNENGLVLCPICSS